MSDEYPCKYLVATLSTRLIKCVGKWDQDIQSTGYVWEVGPRYTIYRLWLVSGTKIYNLPVMFGLTSSSGIHLITMEHFCESFSEYKNQFYSFTTKISYFFVEVRVSYVSQRENKKSVFLIQI